MQEKPKLTAGWKEEHDIIHRELIMHERIQYRLPGAIVTLGGEIAGHIDRQSLENAIEKLTTYHPLLHSRVVLESNGTAYLELTDHHMLPLIIIKDPKNENLLPIIQQQWRTTFDIANGPLTRILWIQTDQNSLVFVMCHHVICDGLSLVYVLRDLLTFLGTPSLVKSPLKLPPAINATTIPPTVKESAVINAIIRIINAKWAKERKVMNDIEYYRMVDRFWQKGNNNFLLGEFSAEEVKKLKEKCKQAGVKLNAALMLAFTAAVQDLCPPARVLNTAGFAVDTRSKMQISPEEGMGIFVGAARIHIKMKKNREFWAQVQKIQQQSDKIRQNLNNMFQMVRYNGMDPTFLDMIHFVMYGGQSSKLIQKYLKKKGMGEGSPMFGMVLTNLGHILIPDCYGGFHLERLLFIPGGSDSVKYAIALITYGTKMAISVNWRESTGDPDTAHKIFDRVKKYLF